MPMATPQSAALAYGRYPRHTRAKKRKITGSQMALSRNCGVVACPMKPEKVQMEAPRMAAAMGAPRSRQKKKQNTAATQWISTQYQCSVSVEMWPSLSGIANRIQLNGL